MRSEDNPTSFVWNAGYKVAMQDAIEILEDMLGTEPVQYETPNQILKIAIRNIKLAIKEQCG